MDPSCFVGEIENFACAICLNVVKDPVEHIDCEKLFCKECIDEVQCQPSPRNNCPTCRQSLRNRTKGMHRVVRDFYEKLQMKCPHSELGCTAVFAWTSKAKHEEVCAFNQITCQYCQASIPTPQQADHEQTVCPKFVLTCSIVGCAHKTPRESMDAHNRECYFVHNELNAARIRELEEEVKRLKESQSQSHRSWQQPPYPGRQPRGAEPQFQPPRRPSAPNELNGRPMGVRGRGEGYGNGVRNQNGGRGNFGGRMANRSQPGNNNSNNNSNDLLMNLLLRSPYERGPRGTPFATRRSNEINSRVGMNANRVMCHRSLDSYHTQKLRVYCGTTCGQSGYSNPCGGCDGRCGPDSGCQCHVCHDFDEELERREQLLGSLKFLPNRDGANVLLSYNIADHGDHGQRYVFYCGRQVGQEGYHQPCVDCDGRCGPNNGCQCEACYQLDELYDADRATLESHAY